MTTYGRQIARPESGLTASSLRPHSFRIRYLPSHPDYLPHPNHSSYYPPLFPASISFLCFRPWYFVCGNCGGRGKVSDKHSILSLLDDGEQAFDTRASLLTFICSIEFIRYVLLGKYVICSLPLPYF